MHRLLLIAVLLLVVVSPTLAADPKAKQPKAKVAKTKEAKAKLAKTKEAKANEAKANEPGFYSKEEYSACLDSEDRLNARRKTLEEQVTEINAATALIQTEAAALVEEQKNLILTDAVQVEAFNKRTEAYSAKVKSSVERAEQLNAEQEAYHATLMEHNKKCATLVVKITDREAVMKERTAAGKQ